MKLWQLVKSHLGPYRNVLLLVVVLQSIATFAALTLPTINALLIDNGVLQGDNDYILTMGAVMLGFTHHPDHLRRRRGVVRVPSGDGVRP